MRQLILNMSVSLDGFVADPDRKLDWLFGNPDAELTAATTDALSNAGVHAMGRATYLDMATAWPDSSAPQAAPMNEIPKVVFSQTLTEGSWADTRIANGDLADEVARLKAEPGKEILAHGGVRLAQSLASLRLIDEYRLRIHPVALGKGLPLFVERQRLTLHDTRRFPSGVVVHTYRPA